MTAGQRRGRPGGMGRPAEIGLGEDLNLTSSLELADPLDALARHLDGAFVLVVQSTGGRHRRRCFLSAASAERAAYKANQAGHNAVVYLAQLKPLYRLVSGSR